MLPRIYLPVIFFWITIIFGNKIVQVSTGESENENETMSGIVSSDVDQNKPETTKTGNKVEPGPHLKETQRHERLEEEMRKGKGSKKGDKGMSDDLCKKFLYIIPLLTIIPILFLIWKTPKHESYHHSYTPYQGHGHHHHKSGWNQDHQNYYKKLDDNTFDFYRQPLPEHGVPA